MNQRKKAPLALILLLSVAIIAQITFTNTAKANFVFPPANPTITFKSPVNTTYNTCNVSLTVEFYTYKTGYYGAPEDQSLRQFNYSIDGGNFQTIEITKSSVGLNPGTDVYFEGLINLKQLSEGRHDLTVKAVLDYSDLNYPHVGYAREHYHYHTESEATTYLVVNAIPDILPTLNSGSFVFLLVIPVLAVIAIVCVFVFIHHTRFKRQSSSKIVDKP